MARPAYPTRRVPTIIGALILAACVLALVAAQEPAEAAFPGKSGKIAFHDYHPLTQTDSEIWVVKPDGSGLRQVTNNAVGDFVPSWAPDGTKIAFQRLTSHGHNEILVKNIKTGQLVRLSDPNDSMEETNPSWSPDGTRMVFVGYNLVDGSREIWVMNSDGSERKQLTTNSLEEDVARWSPDGSKIAFSTGINQTEIYVMNADGTNLQNLTNTPFSHEHHFTWAPDGSKIAYFRYRPDSLATDIFVMNADGSGRWNLTKTPEIPERQPSWSPNGRKIVFQKPNADGWWNLWTMNAGGDATPQNITDSTSSEQWHPDWQPIPQATP